MIIDGTRAHDRATALIPDDYAAFNRADWRALLSLLAEDVVHDALCAQPRYATDVLTEHLSSKQRFNDRDIKTVAVLDQTSGSQTNLLHANRVGLISADRAQIPAAIIGADLNHNRRM